MDVTEDHFRTFGYSSPLLFLGIETYTHRILVVWMLGTLSAEKPSLDQLLVSDEPTEMLRFLESHRSVRSQARAD